jgi:hypothetical protein
MERNEMANGWTDERRAKQAALIHRWKPWEKSTGAKTSEGKAKSARNAFRLTMRKHLLFVRWMAKQSKNLRTGKPYASRDEFMQKAASFGFDPAEFADL